MTTVQPVDQKQDLKASDSDDGELDAEDLQIGSFFDVEAKDGVWRTAEIVTSVPNPMCAGARHVEVKFENLPDDCNESLCTDCELHRFASFMSMAGTSAVFPKLSTLLSSGALLSLDRKSPVFPPLERTVSQVPVVGPTFTPDVKAAISASDVSATPAEVVGEAKIDSPVPIDTTPGEYREFVVSSKFVVDRTVYNAMNMECSICNGVPIDPVFFNNCVPGGDLKDPATAACFHGGCNRCVSSWLAKCEANWFAKLDEEKKKDDKRMYCMICKHAVTLRQMQSNVLISRHLVGLLVRCCFPNCDEKMKFGKNGATYFEHARVCKHRQFPCENAGCTVMMQGAQIEKHPAECTMRLVACPNGCAVGKVLFADVDKHKEVCALQKIMCLYKAHGCNVLYQRRDRQKHMTTCVHDHLQFVMQTVKNNEQSIAALLVRLQKLESHPSLRPPAKKFVAPKSATVVPVDAAAAPPIPATPFAFDLSASLFVAAATTVPSIEPFRLT